jgi:lipid-binding SYLF domain-containing protein
VGPLGRTAGSDLRAGKGGVAAAFAYAHSRGLFVGVSIEAGVVINRPDVNEAYYGSAIPVGDIKLIDLTMSSKGCVLRCSNIFLLSFGDDR